MSRQSKNWKIWEATVAEACNACGPGASMRDIQRHLLETTGEYYDNLSLSDMLRRLHEQGRVTAPVGVL